jgi:hypothetical protein
VISESGETFWNAASLKTKKEMEGSIKMGIGK